MRPGSRIIRSLDRLREEGRALDLVELARRLLAMRGSLEPGVARRLLAAALECPPESLPERFDPPELTAARHGLLGRPAPASDPPRSEGLRWVSMPLARASFAVVDLETTGLDVRRSAILEIGAVRVEAGAITSRFETLVDPGVPIPRFISDLTGIDQAKVVDAPRPRAALVALRRWLEATPAAAFVAHNARFDEGFLRRGFDSHGIAPFAGPVLCTRRLGRRLVPELRVYNLDAVCAHFGVSNPARHRALGDAESTARVLLELLALAVEHHRLATLGDLLDLQDRALRRRRKGPGSPDCR